MSAPAVDVINPATERVVATVPLTSAEQTDAAMRESMTKLLHDVQHSYEHPEGAYWVPRRMCGSAPTMAEAKALDEAELAERARKRAEREARS